MQVGLAPGLPAERQLARQLAENDCRVVVPVLIDRKDTWSGSGRLGRWTNQPHREFIYRMSYEMGRHPLGYEVQKVLAMVDWFGRASPGVPVGVAGQGEGGLLALFSAALDPRIRTVVAGGCFAPWEDLWQQPIYRNVWRLLREFGAAEVASLHGAGSKLVIDVSAWPAVSGPPQPRAGRGGAAPGKLTTPDLAAIRAEFARLEKLGFHSPRKLLDPNADPSLLAAALLPGQDTLKPPGKQPVDGRKGFDPDVREKRQFDQLVDFTQKVMRDSEYRRQDTFWSKLDVSSPEKYEASCRPLRDQLGDVIGKLPPASAPINPLTRRILDEPKWQGYEVTLDLYPDVFAYGILLLPKDLKAGEKRPVVVCQHGLEGRPSDVVNPRKRTPYYNSFGAQLADRGYIVYAPQNPYIGQDLFRVLQRKGNPLGLSLFSFIVRQHERTLGWLATLPNVDAGRIAFYGLSYGGKTAMRVPALVPGYCLSICSGDFNEWIWKNVSVEYRNSYMFSGEYEMPEFDLGHTFNYAEMAGLIAPRPFMVERGHDDGVGIDEWVAYEYAKVRRLYSRLKLPERTEIEFFAGGHEVHGQGTFRFLQKHLAWPN
jgi:dienelactone hydrolase